MRKAVCAVAAVAISALGICSPASAFEGGGRSPSQAPTIVVGQHYTGQLNNHRDDANYSAEYEVAFWRLPPVSTRDVVPIDWHGVPFTRYPGQFPLCMSLVQGIDDFNWGNRFDTEFDCDDTGTVFGLSGSGTAHTEITVQEATTDTSYLEFFVSAYQTDPDDYETYPYDFTVGPILHYLDAALKPVERVSATGVIHATANLSTGQPAPDGLPFNLTVTWDNGGIATYSATTSAGVATFQLALPETAFGENATFVASHPADGNYQSAETSKLNVKVAKPKAPPPSACELAEGRAIVLTRQFKRLKHNARRATGANKRRLSRRAKRVKRRLGATRREVAALCV
jgi:hypothetical protein